MHRLCKTWSYLPKRQPSCAVDELLIGLANDRGNAGTRRVEEQTMVKFEGSGHQGRNSLVKLIGHFETVHLLLKIILQILVFLKILNSNEIRKKNLFIHSFFTMLLN